MGTNMIIGPVIGSVTIGSNVNPPVPVDALKFEDIEEYIFFEGQSEPDYITFETN